MYRETTNGIEVTVRPEYLDSESDAEKSRWFWAYTIIVANHTNDTYQLESRYWHITNALGVVEEVSGMGVIGEQPVLTPGDSFQYTSGCPLNTSSGTMMGHYVMRRDDGRSITVDVPPFSLDLPDAPRILN
ncbi:MAG: Co2+/Mg2+ efflux protein ApaG [Pseudomonadota bacterium]